KDPHELRGAEPALAHSHASQPLTGEDPPRRHPGSVPGRGGAVPARAASFGGHARTLGPCGHRMLSAVPAVDVMGLGRIGHLGMASPGPAPRPPRPGMTRPLTTCCAARRAVPPIPTAGDPD